MALDLDLSGVTDGVAVLFFVGFFSFFYFFCFFGLCSTEIVQSFMERTVISYETVVSHVASGMRQAAAASVVIKP